MGMLLGSLVGIQIGAMVTKVVNGITIRGFYAMAVLAGFVNRIFALPAKLGAMEVHPHLQGDRRASWTPSASSLFHRPGNLCACG